MIFLILRTRLFAAGTNSEIRVTASQPGTTAYLEFFVSGMRVGLLTFYGFGIDARPALTDSPIPLVELNFIERAFSRAVIRHYLKRDTRAAMRTIVQLILC